jgi:hypothetical protein
MNVEISSFYQFVIADFLLHTTESDKINSKCLRRESINKGFMCWKILQYKIQQLLIHPAWY